MGHSRTPAQDTAGEGFPAGPLELLAYRPSERLHNVWGGATGARVRLERLGPQHTLDDFYCGNTDLDAWLKRHALAARQMGSARTFVLIEGDRVVGYFSLTMGAVLRAQAPGKLERGLPSYPVGTVLLARLAVHSASQGQGLGVLLLAEALKAVTAGEPAAARLVVVDAIEDAARFYPSPVHRRPRAPFQPLAAHEGRAHEP
jgi:GNAT superfamily N-acetyltransferase